MPMVQDINEFSINYLG